MSEASNVEPRSVRVWDFPTRVFHWSLVALVVIAWLTGEEEGSAAVVHRYVGEAIAGLIVFRVIWGFTGGEHARFSDFSAGPAAIIHHIRDLFAPAPKRHLGHNPLGGFAVLLLLISVSAVVVTGLFSGGEVNAGPFAGALGLELSEAHEVAFRVLEILVIVHLLGVFVESWRSKDGLVPAMITGRKRRSASEHTADARTAGASALLIAAALGLAVSAALIVQTPSTLGAGGSERGVELDHD